MTTEPSVVDSFRTKLAGCLFIGVLEAVRRNALSPEQAERLICLPRHLSVLERDGLAHEFLEILEEGLHVDDFSYALCGEKQKKTQRRYLKNLIRRMAALLRDVPDVHIMSWHLDVVEDRHEPAELDKAPMHACACCGHITLVNPTGSGSNDTCPVCHWEDNGVQNEDPLAIQTMNPVCLMEARKNYKAFGACHAKFKDAVRPPLPSELLFPPL